jgi:hypothetical protein
MHYSGVVDSRAVELHPEWAARDAAGKLGPRNRVTSVFGPYVDELMIPQLRELAGDYHVDGAWVDGDCWGAMVDYSDAALAAWKKETGETTAPQDPADPRWQRWMDFHREGYRRYLRRYVDALGASHPQFQVISNWAFSGHMPEAVCAGVAALSGDFSPDDSVNSARFAGRCLENQGLPWDLMAWSFSRKTRKQKPAVQLMQEAAIVLAQGGGFQAYFKQDRDGAVRDMKEMEVMAEVARFCRARQPFCHRSKAVPQIALLYSTAGHYHSSNRLFHPSGSDGIPVLQKALTALLEDQQAVQIVSEHHLEGKLTNWPLIIVPGWGYLNPSFRDELAGYAKNGGKLLLIGEGPAGLFADHLETAAGMTSVPDAGESFLPAVRRLFPEPLVTVTGSPKVDVSPRRLDGRLGIHLINTAGPHANAPDGGIVEIPSVGPLKVAIRLPTDPQSIVVQPAGSKLSFTRQDDRVIVTVPQLDLYDILEIHE